MSEYNSNKQITLQPCNLHCCTFHTVWQHLQPVQSTNLLKLCKTMNAFLADKCPGVPKLDVLNNCTSQLIKHTFTQVRQPAINNTCTQKHRYKALQVQMSTGIIQQYTIQGNLFKVSTGHRYNTAIHNTGKPVQGKHRLDSTCEMLNQWKHQPTSNRTS